MMNALVFAAAKPFSKPDDFPWWVLLIVFAAIFAFGVLMLVLNHYKSCRPDQILVISGKVSGGMASRPIHGGAAFVWPLIQEHNYLSLEPIQIEIPLKGAL